MGAGRKGYNARKGIPQDGIQYVVPVSRALSPFNPQPCCINHLPTMLILPGSNALSAFRSQRLLSQLQAAVPAVAAVQARFVHFIDASAPLTADGDVRLAGLLTYGEPAHTEQADGVLEEFFVIPRFGTISPWASKATDIAATAAWRISSASSAASPSASAS